MICDTLDHIARYKGAAQGLDLVISWLGEHKLEELPLGRTELDGSRVFVNVMEAVTRPAAQARYEVHRRYMDLQVDLEGAEAFQVLLGPVTEASPFDPEGDVGFCTGETGVWGRLGPGRFVLFPAGEPHMPTLNVDGCAPVKKAVFKILEQG